MQEAIDRAAAADELTDPADPDYILQLDRNFYAGASEAMLDAREGRRAYLMTPGEWRSRSEHEMQIGRHLPPCSARVTDFMSYFGARLAFEPKNGMRMTAVGACKYKRILGWQRRTAG